jgi:hypothetical protein
MADSKREPGLTKILGGHGVCSKVLPFQPYGETWKFSAVVLMTY